MHIGIEAESANSRAKTGIEHYAKQLILHLAKVDRANRYTLYLRREPDAWLRELPENFQLKVMPFPRFWTQLRLSWELLWHPVDVLFVPLHRLPLIHPRRSVVTLHDTNFMHNPDTDTAWGRWSQYWTFRYLARTAWRIVAISESTRQDLVQLFAVAPERMRVVHHGYEQAQREDRRPSPELAAKLPERYVLFLSTIQPRKNVSRLIEAFVQLKREHPELPHKLVLAGGLGWKYEEILARIHEHDGDVVYLGHVRDEDRWPLYRGADLYVLPSVNEGFGLGVLEAFQCGVPVAVSNVSSLPEVAGDAAIYFDPYSPAEISAALWRGLSDPELRRELVARGRERLSAFSWERCARETLRVLTGEGA